MLAEIIAVGSEMLTPYRQDTNSLYLTAGLNDLGVSVAFKTIVGDNHKRLASAIRVALNRADILLLSGGLGPTEDDLTRECLAEALHLKLHRDNELLESLNRRFAGRNIAMPPNNARQADMLDGATLLPNPNGSAPGQWLDTVVRSIDGQSFRKLVILLPGPPKELKARSTHAPPPSTSSSPTSKPPSSLALPKFNSTSSAPSPRSPKPKPKSTRSSISSPQKWAMTSSPSTANRSKKWS
jgi:molybdenum cofactor synthesis domain-containing protein